MKPHQILSDHGYSALSMGKDLFPQIARYAADLPRENPNISVAGILAAVAVQFGTPAVQMRLKPTPEHVEVVGTYGVDFDVPVNGQPPQMSSMVQMNTAMRLPVGVAGALMPDAHPSAASLPVGGVALLENAISPKMVGPDISCSMRFTPLQGVSVADARKYQQAFLTAIVHGTHFGPGAAIFADGRIREHAIMDDSAWGDLPQAEFPNTGREVLVPG